MCLDNTGYSASLEIGKCYRWVRALGHDTKGWMRVIDESGEDYLFPADRFVEVNLPAKARRAVATAAH